MSKYALTRTLLLVAALCCGGVASAFLAAVLGQLSVLPYSRLDAAAAGLVAFAPGVITPFAINCIENEHANMYHMNAGTVC